MSTPQEGEGGGSPKPRNATPASTMIAAGMMMLAFTIASGSRFGRMWRSMIRVFDAPTTRAASTYAVDASCSTLPRSTSVVRRRHALRAPAVGHHHHHQSSRPGHRRQRTARRHARHPLLAARHHQEPARAVSPGGTARAATSLPAGTPTAPGSTTSPSASTAPGSRRTSLCSTRSPSRLPRNPPAA